MELSSIINTTLALLALINPISKIFIISTIARETGHREVRHIALKATGVAMVILLVFLFLGNFLLAEVFRVELYSFKIAGGLVLLYRGFEALNKGIFFELNYKQKLEDLSIVPLASPMIAGPATITAAVSFPIQFGMGITVISIIIAVIINLLVMLASPFISDMLDRHNIMGALIRITGLIVATIGIQMTLDGLGVFIGQL